MATKEFVGPVVIRNEAPWWAKTIYDTSLPVEIPVSVEDRRREHEEDDCA